jgi:hypothetical protein
MSDTANLRAIPVSNQSIPKQGSVVKTFPFSAQFTGSVVSIDLDLTNAVAKGIIDNIQCVYVDNLANPAPISISSTITHASISIPAYTQAWAPILVANPPQFTFASTGATTVNIFFMNVPMPFGTISGANDDRTPTVLTSRSTVTPGTATSTVLMAANPMRKYALIKAPEAGDLWINPLGGVAGVNLTNCIKIPAGIPYETGDSPWTGAITYYSAATTAVLTAFEA